MGTHHPIRKTVTKPAPVIPDKLYFRIGDVARLCEVPAYVLRFWETEFPNLKPNKGGTGQRLYRRKDVETALRIKHLLYDLGYTIPGARQVFKTDAAAKDAVPQAPASTSTEVSTVARPAAVVSAMAAPVAPHDTNREAQLTALRDELRALHAQLSAPLATSDDAANDLTPRKAMRPRLVMEPKPRAEAKQGNGPVEMKPAGSSVQQALFPVE
jgi:DNA-binding transcriptional MerR regulator